ncbi:hypothetical protein ACP4OV_029921 [Aristida adscensionis]
MKRSGFTSLLVILLLALHVAGLSTAVSIDETDTIIRLPSDGKDVADDEDETAVKNVGERPRKCCNQPECTRSRPPICHCRDKVSRCSRSCRRCEEVSPGSHRYRCMDSYTGQPGPKCNEAGEDQDVDGGLVDDESEKTVKNVGERPWKCCNHPRCSKSHPPVCHCMDKVPRCSSSCRRCEQVSPGSHRYRCMDSYRGEPGPKCNEDTDDKDIDDGASCMHSDTRVADDDEDETTVQNVSERPWKCCNQPECTRSRPPICHCMDKVPRCSSSCKRCEEVRPGSRRYRCMDSYRGQPGPKCNQDGADAAAGGD